MNNIYSINSDLESIINKNKKTFQKINPETPFTFELVTKIFLEY